MKALLVPLLTALLAMAPVSAFAHHDDDCGNLDGVMEAAHELKHAAEHFHDLIHEIADYSHLAEDAHRLDDEANAFHERLHEGATCPQVKEYFETVEDAYFHLKREFRAAHDVHHDEHAAEDFAKVEEAFRAVNAAVYGGVVVPPPPPPPAHTITKYVPCSSSRYQYNQCDAGGVVLQAQVAQQFSRAACILGRTFGYQGNIVWVNLGCSANFLVTVQVP